MRPVFERLRRATRALLLAATPTDRLWLATADGQLRAGTRDALLAEVDAMAPMQGRGDLPLALRRAVAAVQSAALPARVVAVATDAQRTSWSDAVRAGIPVTVHAPVGEPPRNRAVLAASAEPTRWTPRGAISARIDAPDSVGYRVVLGERTLARGAVGRGEPVALRVAPPERAWQAGRVEVEPDDYPADDARHFAVWIGSAPSVSAAPSAGSFVSTALGVLAADGRASAGEAVRIASADAVTTLPALILPPADPVRLGAANRELARLGVPWRFAAIDRTPGIARGDRLDGTAVRERYRLVREGAALSDTLATAGGAPWIVAGPRYVLVGSRLDPTATDLPGSRHVPPVARGCAGHATRRSRRRSRCPDRRGARRAHYASVGTEALESASGTRRAAGDGASTAPAERGVWFVLAGGRRVGAIVVNAPPEESSLARWRAGELATRLAGRDGRASGTADAWVRDSFAAGTRRPAVTPLLALALALIAAEAIALRTSRSTAA